MKVLFILPILLGLTACNERPIYTADKLHCENSDSVETTKMEFYKDYVVVYSKNTKTRLDLVRQFDNLPRNLNVYAENGYQDLSVFADPEKMDFGIVYKDHRCFFDETEENNPAQRKQTKIIDKEIIQKIFALSDIEKTYRCIDKICELTYTSRLCDIPVGPEGVDIAIGNGSFRHYSQIEAQENHIYDCSVPAKYAVIVNGFGMLTQEQALKITKNWDYSNIKLYNHEDNKIQDYEKDACEVLERLNNFIKDNSGNKSDYEILQNELKGKDIPVIETGTMGDFMIKIPETPELKKIADKRKNSMFLSVKNPNPMSEDGYCLINTIPLNTWKKLGSPDNTCHYRIYCGHLTFVDYDEPYAVEICE